MIRLEKGMVVRSKAGHDKGTFYIIADVHADCVLLADGASRSLEAPKKKNPIHLSPTKTVLPPEKLTNSEIRSTLAYFQGRVRTS